MQSALGVGIITTEGSDAGKSVVSRKNTSWCRFDPLVFLYCYIVLHTPQLPTASIYGNTARGTFVKYVNLRTDPHYGIDAATIIDDSSGGSGSIASNRKLASSAKLGDFCSN